MSAGILFFTVLIGVCLITRCSVVAGAVYATGNEYGITWNQTNNSDPDIIHLALVSCGGGSRLEETVVLLKSAVLFTTQKLRFHLFADQSNGISLTSTLLSWPRKYRERFEFSVYNISFPPGKTNWIKIFKPCATQRLFIPYIIDPKVKRLIYVDTDTLILGPLSSLWEQFNYFNATQAAGLTIEDEILQPVMRWLQRPHPLPIYGRTGLNSGVMLMDVVKLRAARWQENMTTYYSKYGPYIQLGDQDLINIFFHFYPEMVFLVPCKWNYRYDNCMLDNNCQSADTDGVVVLHGSRAIFHRGKPILFRTIYNTIKNFDHDIQEHLVKRLEFEMSRLKPTNCTKVQELFIRNIKGYDEEESKWPLDFPHKFSVTFKRNVLSYNISNNSTLIAAIACGIGLPLVLLLIYMKKKLFCKTYTRI